MSVSGFTKILTQKMYQCLITIFNIRPEANDGSGIYCSIVWLVYFSCSADTVAENKSCAIPGFILKHIISFSFSVNINLAGCGHFA